MDALARAEKDQLIEIDEIGEKMSESIYSFFREEHNKEIIDQLKELGLNMEGQKREIEESWLTGKNFVITGKFADYSRSQLKEMIEKLGGKVRGSVSKNTDYLLYGEEAGSKKDRAQELGTQMLTEEEFLQEIKDFI